MGLKRNWIEVDSISVTNFEFDQDFIQAIEEKVVATQRAQQAENKLREIEAIARQRKAEARGDANAAIARAEGEAKSMAILAEAQAAASAKIRASLTPMINQYRLIEKLAGEARVIIVPATSSFVIGSDLLK